MSLKIIVPLKLEAMPSIKQEIYLLLYIQNLQASFKMKTKIKFKKIHHKKKVDLLLKKQETLL
jgi:hypothetical protein